MAEIEISGGIRIGVYDEAGIRLLEDNRGYVGANIGYLERMGGLHKTRDGLYELTGPGMSMIRARSRPQTELVLETDS